MNNAVVVKWQSMAPRFQGILRIMAAAMYITHGSAKLFAQPYALMPDGATANLLSQFGVAGILEVVGGTLLLLGFCTRPIAFLLAGEMAVAYFQMHFPNSPWPWANAGEPAYLYCFLWLYFSAAGAGSFSLDALRKK